MKKSFFVLAGAHSFERLRADRRLQSFLAGAAPAAVGAIIGAAVPLAGSIATFWQVAIALLAAVALLIARRTIVVVLLGAAGCGALIAIAGAPLPR